MRCFNFIGIIFALLFTTACQMKAGNEVSSGTTENSESTISACGTADAINRLKYLLLMNLPEKEKQLIVKLKKLIEGGLVRNSEKEQFELTALELARLIPESDFLIMFYTMRPYKYMGEYVGKTAVSEKYIKEISTLTRVQSEDAAVGRKDLPKIKCNCRWFCSSGSSDSNCMATEAGCGFMWRYSCTYYG